MYMYMLSKRQHSALPAALSASPKAKKCYLLPPLDNCVIGFDAEGDIAPNSLVSLQVSFTTKVPLVKGDTVEIGLGGFKADFPDMSNVKIESKTIYLPPAEDMPGVSIPEYDVYDDSSDISVNRPTSSSQGCYKTVTDGIV